MAKLPPRTPWQFKRVPVADQAAAALRDAIRCGELSDPLPGEHQLARQLGISRPSLRAALANLATEGLIVVKKGFRSRITKLPKTRSSVSRRSVCIICPVSPESLYFQEHPVLAEMYAEFARRDVHWEVVFDPRLEGSRAEVRLKQLVAARPHSCWILFGASEVVHRWFTAQALPTLVVGSCSPGVNLPSVDTDYGAVGWHAAGTLVKNGHKRIALLLPPKLLPGDVATRMKFLRYIEQQAEDVTVLDWFGPNDLLRRRAALNQLLTGPRRPTALLSWTPGLTFAFYLHAPSLGLRIPQDVSIVSRDSHPFFDWTMPELTRYSSTAKKLAKRAVRIATSLLTGQSVPITATLLTPTFVAGTTLAKSHRNPPVC